MLQLPVFLFPEDVILTRSENNWNCKASVDFKEQTRLKQSGNNILQMGSADREYYKNITKTGFCKFPKKI